MNNKKKKEMGGGKKFIFFFFFFFFCVGIMYFLTWCLFMYIDFAFSFGNEVCNYRAKYQIHCFRI